MGYTTVPTQATGEAWTASEMNTYVRNNFIASPVDVVTTAGDIVVASAANTPARLAIGTNGQLLEAKSSETTGRRYADSGLVPIGGILIWSGATGAIPTGWQICDGTNGTPDLRDRFLVGAGDTYAVTDTGGATSIDIEHSHTLTSPTASGGAHTHTQANTSTDGAHAHTLSGTTSHEYQSGTVTHNAGDEVSFALENHHHTYSGTTSTDGAHAHENPTTGSGAAHTHTFDDLGTNSQLSTTQATLPPYYALAYVQRLS